MALIFPPVPGMGAGAGTERVDVFFLSTGCLTFLMGKADGLPACPGFGLPHCNGVIAEYGFHFPNRSAPS